MNKKIIEVISGIIVVVACVGVFVWLYITYTSNGKAQESSATPSVTLKKISVSELEKIESNSLSALKNLKIFGKIPVRASGAERSKSDLFKAESENNEKGKYKAQKFAIEYPGSWVQNIETTDKTTSVVFEAPISEKSLKTSGLVSVIDKDLTISDHDNLESTLKSQLSSTLGISGDDLSGYNIESSDDDKASGVMRGRIKFSYTDGKTTKKGWIGGLYHQSPSSKLSSKIYSLIMANKNGSTYLSSLTPTLENTQTSIAEALQTRALVNELAALGKEITYNIKPYNVVVIYLFETKSSSYDDLNSGADYIFTHTKFTETVNGAAVEK